MLAERDGAAKGHAFFRDGVLVHFEVVAAEVGAAAAALRFEGVVAGVEAAGAPFAAITVHSGVFVDDVRADVDLLSDAVVSRADL